ncbi:MAG: endonuclease/exonuclease/phosphatase family protein [Myxococcales bacterium]|nr:endonuclease/exonuclease/phosphatase family protein [Myxococcales bacterium]
MISSSGEFAGVALPKRSGDRQSAGGRLRRVGLVLTWLFGVVALATTLCSFLPFKSWWVRVFDFPRPQIAVVALLSLASLAALRWKQRAWQDWVFAALLLGASIYQGLRIVPYSPLVTPQASLSEKPAPERQLKLFVANVLMHNEDPTRLRDIIRAEQSDVLLLVETNQRWVDDLASVTQSYPHQLLKPLENTYGLAFYSRLKLEEAELRYLVQSDIPSVRTKLVLPSGDQIQFYGIHPRPPVPTEHDRSTERDAELLLVAREARDSKLPVIVAGDLNDVAWSTTTHRFQRISRLLDPRIGRGLFPTFHAEYPLMRWPLDHVFFSKRLQLVELNRLEGFGSDHFPISISLCLEPAEASENRAPEQPDQDDHESAQQTIQDAEQANSP